jgi:hypothetical protein
MLDTKKIFRTRMTFKIFSASRNICFLYLITCVVAIGNLSFQQNFVYAYEASTTSSSTFHPNNAESNNVESSLIPIITSEKQPLPSLVMNVSNDVNNNTNTKINNQNISALASPSSSLPASAIQVNADFNHDGFADLAIGVPDEDVGSIVDAGAVNVIYGSPSGLSATAARTDQFWHQNTANVEDVAEPSDRFGSALATGDFNKDGFADLAIGVKNEDVGSLVDAGAVNVIYGSPSGLSTTVKPDQLFQQGAGGLDDSPQPLDQFGSALAIGDFNKDGFADLAIGVNNEDVDNDNIHDAGIVQVIYGSPSGLSTTVKPDQLFRQGAGGLDDIAEELDHFGRSITAGDFNNDAIDDLVVGIPHESITASQQGIVQVIYGSPSGLSTSAVLPDQLFRQGAGGLDDIAELSDTFGWSVAAGDFNNDRFADLAVGAPSEDFGGFHNAGIVQVIYGSPSGLSTSAVLPDQLFLLADGSSPGNDDSYGLTLSAGDFNHGAGGVDLAVGAQSKQIGSSTNAGIVHVLYGSSSGLGNNPGIANHILAQGINGLDDIVETDDKFGQSLSSADFNGDGSTDLAVGIPGEDVDGISDAGAVNVIYGNHISGLVPLGTIHQFWTQKIHNELQRDIAESGDGLGTSH